MTSLKSVIIYNFKSYQGLKKVTQFNQFTVIIGPNGSGKSNFMDAIAFALGENWENLRVSDLLKLIYCEKSQNPKPNSSCYVEISFRLEDDNEKIFKRTLFANTKRNKYEFNGSSVSIEDYKAELKSIGILDFGKNCLAYQEDVESIIKQDPKARCRFFERMCGSQNLEKEYKIVEHNLEKLNAEGKLNFDKLKILKRKIKDLTEENKRRIEYENLKEEEITWNKYQQLFYLYHEELDIEKLENAINTKKEFERSLEETILEEKRKLKELQESIKDEKITINQLETTINEKEILMLREKSNLGKKNLEIKQYQERRVIALKNCDDLKRRSINRKENLLELNRNKEFLINQLNNIDEKIMLSPDCFNDEQFKEYNDLKLTSVNRTANYEHELNLEKERLENHKYRLENKNREKCEITGLINLYTKQCEQIIYELNREKEQLENVNKSLIEEEKLREILQNEVNAFSQNKIQDLEKELESIKLNQEYYKRQRKNDEVFNKMKSYFHPKIHGRLSDLCKPRDSRYKIAIAKIIDHREDFIVIDSINNVEKCTKFLQNHNGGYEGFFSLDFTKVKPINPKIRTIENAKCAFDLIDFPEEVEPAVRFAAGNFLVCETNKIAIKLSSGGYNCVTLDGIMFTNDGQISSGMSRVSEISQKFDEEKWKLRKIQIKNELKNASEIQSKKDKLDELNRSTEALRMKIPFIENQMKKSMEEKEKLETKLSDLNCRDEEIKSAIEEIKNELLVIKAAIKMKGQEIDEIVDVIFADFCQKLGFENIRVFECGGSDYEEREIKIKEIRNHLVRLNTEIDFEDSQYFDDEISKKETIVTELETEIENKMQIKENIEAIINDFENEIKTIQNDLQVKKANIQESLDICNNFMKVIKKKSQEITQIQKEIQEMNKNKLVIKNKFCKILHYCRSNTIIIPVLSGNLEDSENIDINYNDLDDYYKSEINKSEAESKIMENLDKIQLKLRNINISDERIDDNILAELKRELLKLNRKISEKKKSLKKMHDTFDKVKMRRMNLFVSFFTKVNTTIDSIYKILTQNDAAQAILVAENPEEPYLSGLMYNCIVPGKKFFSIDGLSGGEKAIAAFALLLAIQKANPAPFMLLDEIDAALDSENVEKITDYIKKEDKQFILISHNEELSSKAMNVIAVTKTGKYATDSCFFTVDLQNYRG